MNDVSTFSGYWSVENNPKPTQGKHLVRASRKKLDFFIGEDVVDFSSYIPLPFSKLPGGRYMKNLTHYCSVNGNVFLKFGFPIDAVTFHKLVRIWVSKLLLFKHVYRKCNSKYLMWVDCVFSPDNYDLIKTTNIRDKIMINVSKQRRGWKYPDMPFGGLLGSKQLPSVKIAGSCIKIPVDILDHVLEVYIECLQYVDNEYPIYDEEVVLSVMYQKHPELFEIVEN